MAIYASGRAGINVRLTESTVVPGTMVDANITFNVLDDAIEFGVSHDLCILMSDWTHLG